MQTVYIVTDFTYIYIYIFFKIIAAVGDVPDFHPVIRHVGNSYLIFTTMCVSVIFKYNLNPCL